MKILGITKTNRSSKANVYEALDVDVSIDNAIKNDAADWSAEYPPYEIRNIRLKNNKGVIRGLLTFDKIKDFAEFLVDEFVPSGDHALDNVVKNISAMKRNQKITFLIDYIAKQYYGTQSYHHNLKEFIPNRSVLEEKKLQENHEIISMKYGDVNVLVLKTDQRKVLYYKHSLKLCGHEIPRWNFIMYMRDSEVCLYWNGQRVQIIVNAHGVSLNRKSLPKTIGESEYDRFNSDGRIKIIPQWKEIIVPQGFIPEKIIRVPAKDKLLKDIVKQDNQEYLPQKPYFLFDTRSSIILDKECEIIDDEAKAANILARSPQGTYLPGILPALNVLHKYVEEEPCYYALGRFNG